MIFVIHLPEEDILWHSVDECGILCIEENGLLIYSISNTYKRIVS